MNDDKLARIRKLLAQAEDPAATEAEAEAFNAKAAELMARHGIDAALLAAGDPGREVVGDLVVDLLAPYAYEKACLGTAVARGLRCSAVLRTSRTRAGDVPLAAPVRAHERPGDGRPAADQPPGAGHRRARPPPRAARRARRRLPPHVVARVHLRHRHPTGRGRGGSRSRGGAGVRRRRAPRPPWCSPTARPSPSGRPRPPIPTCARRGPRYLSGGGADDGRAAGQRADLGRTPRVEAHRPGEASAELERREGRGRAASPERVAP